MSEAYVYDAVRTPIGTYRGGLSSIRPDDLAAFVVRSLLDRHPELDEGSIDEIVMGNANGAGEENRNVARMAGLLAGVPTSVPGVTVNRLCGSGMEAVAGASRSILVGDARAIIAGGVESMSRAPWVVEKPTSPFPQANQTMHSTTLGWRLVNPEMPEQWTVALGEGAEILAERHDIARSRQDEWALRSQQKAARAWEDGAYDDEIVRPDGVTLERDESIRDSTPEKLASLRTVFRPEGTVTAGNASPLSDGAAALLIGDESLGEELGARPLARIAARAATGIDPHLYGLGPVEAAEKALKAAGIGWSQVCAVELNEAFAAQVLACLLHWPDLDPSKVNPLGGALALGHPLGCSGARIVGSLARQLHRKGGGWGVATMCVGVGQGVAIVLEGLE